MVVVVTDAGLVTRDGAGRLDPADQPRRRQCGQHVVYRLARHVGHADRRIAEAGNVVLETGCHELSLRMAAADIVDVAQAEVADIAIG